MKIKIMRHSERYDHVHYLKWWSSCLWVNVADSPLTDNGVTMAENKGRELRNNNFYPSVVYSSPYNRTINTAKEILKFIYVSQTSNPGQDHQDEYNGQDHQDEYNGQDHQDEYNGQDHQDEYESNNEHDSNDDHESNIDHDHNQCDEDCEHNLDNTESDVKIIIEPLLSEYQYWYPHKTDVYPDSIPCTYNNENTDFTFPESYENFESRVAFIVDKIISCNSNSDTILIVTHSEFIKSYINFIRKKSPHNILGNDFNIGYLSSVSFEYNKDNAEFVDETVVIN